MPLSREEKNRRNAERMRRLYWADPAAARAKDKAWDAANREKVRELARRNYWRHVERLRVEAAARMKKRYDADIEAARKRQREYMRKYRARNRELAATFTKP